MKVRIIKRENCKVCSAYLDRLDKVKFQYETMDADANDLQSQMDLWKIRDLPVVQIIEDDGKLVEQFPVGTYSPRAIQHRLSQLQKKDPK